MTYRNLTKTEAGLSTLGMRPLLEWLLEQSQGEAIGEATIPFGMEKAAKRAQRLLYEWLFHHPHIKSRVSLTVKGNDLTVRFQPFRERRGRRGLK